MHTTEKSPDSTQTYWACKKCGRSPIGGINAKEEDKPPQCTNQHCQSRDHLVFTTVKIEHAQKPPFLTDARTYTIHNHQ